MVVLVIIAAILSISVFINQNAEIQVNFIQKPVQYTQISYNTIKGDHSIEKWYQRYYQKKGIHFIEHGGHTYILISAGQRPTGGYMLLLNDMRHISAGAVYVTAKVNHPSTNRRVTQALTYPHLLIKTDDPCVIRVEGCINEAENGTQT
jgi:hypothetical protein